MARKRYSEEDAQRLLREIDVHLHDGLDQAAIHTRPKMDTSKRRTCVVVDVARSSL